MERGAVIILIGFMGSGKSSVGRCLAAKTGRRHFDTDEMISARSRTSVADIFAQHGEEKFRALETEVLGGLPRDAAAIISTGGGIVLRNENVEILRSLGTMFYLTANEEALFARATGSARPLLQTQNPRATFSELLHEREAIYRAVADVTIDTSDWSAEQIASQILEKTDVC